MRFINDYWNTKIIFRLLPFQYESFHSQGKCNWGSSPCVGFISCQELRTQMCLEGMYPPGRYKYGILLIDTLFYYLLIIFQPDSHHPFCLCIFLRERKRTTRKIFEEKKRIRWTQHDHISQIHPPENHCIIVSDSRISLHTQEISNSHYCHKISEWPCLTWNHKRDMLDIMPTRKRVIILFYRYMET